MPVSIAEREVVQEETTRWIWPRPLSFEEFVELFDGRDEIVELVDGSVVLEMAAQFDHENLIAWLLAIFRAYAEERRLGTVLGSRTAVEINQFNGRLPDLLFVRRDRMEVVRQRAVYGPPDLVIEVRSPGDRKSATLGLESDYRSIGVAELLLIDPKRRRVRVLRKREGGYVEAELQLGDVLEVESLPGFWLQVNWLFAELRPTVLEVLNQLLA